MRTAGSRRNGSVLTYIVLCTIIPFAGSLINPVLSLFATTQLHFSPMQVSMLFIVLPLLTVLIVQTLGKFSDRGLERPLIICMSTLGGMLSCGLLELRPVFWLTCSLGVFLLAVNAVAFPQLFASAREFSMRCIRDSLMFTTFLRSLCSLAWVGGPPIAYFISTGYSFDLLFLFSASMSAVGFICTFFFLPSIRVEALDHHPRKMVWSEHKEVILLFLACTGLFTAFSGYMVSMPLYVTQELHLDKSLPGWMFGLAAGLEIPLMLIAARIVRYTGLKNVMILGGFSLVVYLTLLTIMKDEKHFIAIQFFAALFIAMISSMGMVYFQELLPSIPGQATSLFINTGTAGQVLGGAMFALASFGSYRYIFFTALGIAVLSAFAMFFVKKPDSESIKPVKEGKAVPAQGSQTAIAKQATAATQTEAQPAASAAAADVKQPAASTATEAVPADTAAGTAAPEAAKAQSKA